MNSRGVSWDREIYAVLNSADSRAVVRAPLDRFEARRLKARNTFHCSSILGGCGQELTFAIGEMNVPHFRHRPDSACPIASSNSAPDRYTHLAIQKALQEWIQAMPGFDCQLEVLVDDGRTDVLAIGPNFEVSLEVQRSALTAASMMARTETYRHRTGAVDWLYEREGIDACQTEIATRGWTLRIWWGWSRMECRIGVSYLSGTDPAPVVRQLGGQLTEWELTAHGLDSKHLRTAKTAVAHRNASLAADQAAEATQRMEREALLAASRLQMLQRDQQRRDGEYARSRQHLALGSENFSFTWPAEWPMLVGSPKQLEWASRLRSGLVERLKRDIGSPWLSDDLAFRVAHWFAAQPTAKFWIDNCANRDLYEVMESYERLCGRRWLPR